MVSRGCINPSVKLPYSPISNLKANACCSLYMLLLKHILSKCCNITYCTVLACLITLRQDTVLLSVTQTILPNRSFNLLYRPNRPLSTCSWALYPNRGLNGDIQTIKETGSTAVVMATSLNPCLCTIFLVW